jgi:hypothetical protein
VTVLIAQKVVKIGRLVILLVLAGGGLAWAGLSLGVALGGKGLEKNYESIAILQVATPSEVKTDLEKEDFWLQETLAMTTDEVLAPVVAKMGLAEEWGLHPEQSLVLLRGLVSVATLPERNFQSRFSITVRSTDAELARSLAASIATEYQAQGNEKARRRFEEEGESLNRQIAEQKRIVEEKRVRLVQAHREARKREQLNHERTEG